MDKNKTAWINISNGSKVRCEIISEIDNSILKSNMNKYMVAVEILGSRRVIPVAEEELEWSE